MSPKGRHVRPVHLVKLNREPMKTVLLSILTFGIYGMVMYHGAVYDINVIASRYDRKSTRGYAWLFLFGPLTLGIAVLVWFHRVSNRIGGELHRRGCDYSFGARTFWLWCALVPIAGQFVYMHKFCTAMNKLVYRYNVNG